jgi:hypothetical protein
MQSYLNKASRGNEKKEELPQRISLCSNELRQKELGKDRMLKASREHGLLHRPRLRTRY